jgi:fibronectin type 3 domain-containing protein
MRSAALKASRFVVACGFLLASSSLFAQEAPTPWFSRFDTGKPTPVIAGGGPGAWDEFVREKVWVLYDGGIYKMWYGGHSAAGQNASKIGYATSSDGVTWTKHSGNPVVNRATQDQDVCVVKVGTTFYMYIEVGDFTIDLMTSEDGVSWTPHPANPVKTGAASPVIWREGTQWYLFYEEMTLWPFQAYLATSTDGIHWTDSPSNPVLAESTSVVPDSVQKEGTTYHLYWHYSDETGAWHATSSTLTQWTGRHRLNGLHSPSIFVGPTGQVTGYFWNLNGDGAHYLRRGLNLVSPIVWPLDEGTGTVFTDSSGNGARGELAPGASWTGGRLGSALHFNGVNGVAWVGYYANLSTWTAAVWVRSPAAPASGVPNGPLDRGANFRFSWNHTDPALRGAIGIRIWEQWHSASFGTLQANTWYHLAATYDGETLRAYKDGVPVSSNTDMSGPADVEAAPLTLGRFADLSQYFAGDVDDVRIFNHALSDADIAALYTADLTPPTAPVLAALASGQAIDLSWTASSDPESGVAFYRIYRSLGVGQTKSLLAQVSGATLSYHDAAVAPGNVYAYQVAAVNGGNLEGPWSNEVGAQAVNSPPAAPTMLVGTPGNGQANLDWANNTEPDLAGYHVYRSSSGQPYQRITPTAIAASAFTDTGLANGTTYSYFATAVDTGGLESPQSNSVTVTPENIDTTLAARWQLDEGSGTTALDSSGNARHATFTGNPAWTAGRLGGGLAFDGIDDAATPPLAMTFPVWTVSLWVQSPTAPATAPASGPLHGGNMEINWNHPTASWRGSATVRVGWNWYRASFGPLAANVWYHLAATYDGETLRAYKNGVLVTTNTLPSGPPDPNPPVLRLGRHASAAQFFRGSIDEVRVYSRALSAAEIAGLNQTDATPPTTPTLSASTSGQAVTLAWTAAGDPESGIATYRIYRSVGVGQSKNLLATVGGGVLAYQDAATAPSTVYAYQVAAVNGGGAEGTPSNEASALTGNAAPAPPVGLTAIAGNGQIALDWADSTEPDLVGYHVYRADAAGQPFARITASPIAASTFTNTSLTNGTTYYFVVTALDTGGLESGPSAQASATPVAAGAGASAHWRLDDASGVTALDSSGNGSHGTLVGGPVWTTGSFGSGLSFDGVDDAVTTPLLTNFSAWTVSLWVRSPAAPAQGVASGPLHSGNLQINWNHPDSPARGAASMRLGWQWYRVRFGALAPNTWYHLAVTYDGETMRAYRDGVLVGTNASPSGSPDQDDTPVKLGRHATASQFFAGTVDQVRVYNRALTDVEVSGLGQQP